MSPENRNQAQQAEHHNAYMAMAYHGMLASIANARMNRAGSRMERMDHKQAIYADLGHKAVSGENPVAFGEAGERVTNYLTAGTSGDTEVDESLATTGIPLKEGEFLAARTASGRVAQPRTFVERRMVKRMDGRIYNHAVRARRADTYAYQTKKNYHLATMPKGAAYVELIRSQGSSPTVDQVPHPAQNYTDVYARERATKLLFRAAGKSTELGSSPSLDVSLRAKQFLFGTQGIEGKTRNERRLERSRIKRSLKRGDISARDAHLQKLEVNSAPLKRTGRAFRYTAKDQRRTSKRLRHATDQVFLSSWRGMRRDGAIGSIQEHHVSGEAHREALDEARARHTAWRDAREQRKVERRQQKQREQTAREFLKTMTPEQQQTLLDVDAEVGDTIRQEVASRGNNLSNDDFQALASEIRARVYRSNYGFDMTDDAIEQTYAAVEQLSRKRRRFSRR